MSNYGKPNPILMILSILIPLIGYVLYFVKREEDSAVAKNYLWCAVGGSVVGLILVC